MTLGQSEIEENVVGSSSYVYLQPEQIPEYNVEGLRPNIEIQQPTIDTTIAGAISLNLDEFSCLEADQMPQNVRQSLMSVPDESELPPPDSQSSMRKKRELTDRCLYFIFILLYIIYLYFYIFYNFLIYISGQMIQMLFLIKNESMLVHHVKKVTPSLTTSKSIGKKSMDSSLSQTFILNNKKDK